MLIALDLSGFALSQHLPLGGFTIYTKRKGLAAAGCVALIAAATVACDPTDKLSPEGKVERAFDKLSRQKSLSAEFGFDANADKIFSAMKDQKDFDREAADLLASLKLSFAISNDKPLGDVQEGDRSGAGTFKLAKGDKTLVEIRSVGEKFYARGDIKTLAELGGKSKSARSKDRSELGGRGKKAIDDLIKKADQLPPSLDAVKSAVKGDWVSIDAKSFEEFSKAAGKSSGTAKNDGTLDPKGQKQALEAMRKALVDNAKFEDAGSRDGADHVKVTVPAKKAANDLAEGLKPLKDKLGDKFSKLTELDDVPDKDVTVDVRIKDGMLAGLSLDVAQFDKKVKGELPLAIGIKGGAGKVEAPAGAKELKPQDLMGAAMFLFAGGDSGSGGDSPFGGGFGGSGGFGGGRTSSFSKDT
ncbi:hypothetical protein AB0F13_22915 [Streptomyces sp. NPDC026206]|uniref:hypothetical protein n=1 Tax=Streptomyces sp. NPDC026206 TaxID=3157089 RepID=UPI0034051124